MITQLLTPTHLAVLLAILLLLFGPRRLPQTGRALGQTLREFREAIAGQDTARDIRLAAPPNPTPAIVATPRKLSAMRDQNHATFAMFDAARIAGITQPAAPHHPLASVLNSNGSASA